MRYENRMKKLMHVTLFCSCFGVWTHPLGSDSRTPRTPSFSFSPFALRLEVTQDKLTNLLNLFLRNVKVEREMEIKTRRIQHFSRAIEFNKFFLKTQDAREQQLRAWPRASLPLSNSEPESDWRLRVC